MKCVNCDGINVVKFGFFGKEKEIQRFKCKSCASTFSEEQNRPFDSLRLSPEKIKQVVHLLTESVGIRACERLAQIHRDTVMGILEFAGNRCTRIFNKHIVGLTVKEVQMDELYAFVYKKERNCQPDEIEYGDQYTYLAFDPISKLILSYHVGKRDQINTEIFVKDLTTRINDRKHFDLTSDGFLSYEIPVIENFYGKCSYAQLIKNFQTFRDRPKDAPQIPPTEKRICFGKRKNQSICTSHVERLNLSVRTFARRFTRRSICYSKTLANLKHSVSLFVAHYNFCRVHSTIKMTPAMAAGIALNPLTLEELLGINPAQ